MSAALDAIPRPDWADVVVVSLPAGASADPSLWAREIFSLRSAPAWVRALLRVRQVVAGLIGVRRASRSVFDAWDVTGDEALISVADSHLDFSVGVGVDSSRSLLSITTAVRFHGWRGRLYFVPVRFLHDPGTRSMATHAVRRLTRR